MRLFVALVHHPVYNRTREVVCTAITNLDVHDIARACRTYGAEGFLIVNPLERQRWLLERIVRHWTEGHGATAHPNRREALGEVRSAETLEHALRFVRDRCGSVPVTVATTARHWPGAVSFSQMRQRLAETQGVFMILFGTGWGLTDEVISGADHVLEPIMPEAKYNHLSVRSAAAVVLDRLLGDRWAGRVEGCDTDPADREGDIGGSGEGDMRPCR